MQHQSGSFDKVPGSFNTAPASIDSSTGSFVSAQGSIDTVPDNFDPAADTEILEKSSHDYAAYVYLVLKVSFDHPTLYKLINVCGQIFTFTTQLIYQFPSRHVLNFCPNIAHQLWAFCPI
jgi:hypothetical protein